MTNNLIKNLGITTFFAAVFIHVLILNFFPIGIAITSVAIGLILVSALVYRKNQSVVEKIDIFLLIAFLCITALHFEELKECFTVDLLLSSINYITGFQVIALLIGIVLYMVFSIISKKRKTIIARVINKYIGLLLFAFGITIFFKNDVFIDDAILLLSVFSLFGVITFCRASSSVDFKATKRPSRIALLISVFYIVLTVLFPTFRLSEYNFYAFISATLFPWYSVLAFSFVLLSVVGAGLFFSGELIDEDTVFLTGLTGLIWVVKATAYFYFQLNWIAICVYVLIFLNLINRFAKRNASGQQTFVHIRMLNNEFYWMLIVAVSVVLSVYLIHIGYVYFWLSVVIGVFSVLFLHKCAPAGWIRDVAFWIILLISIAVAACMYSFQNGFNINKIILISTITAFSSVIMWMLNHKNNIGQNKFKAVKSAVVIAFTIIVSISAVKAGAHAKLRLEDETAKIGSLLMSETDLAVTVTADGKTNGISNLRYVWSSSFIYDEAEVISTEDNSLNLQVLNNHLIVWSEDLYGVVSRSDYWFYDAARENSNNADIYAIIGEENH